MLQEVQCEAGVPCLRDRVAQTAAMLVVSPIFEADLQPEQYAYRPGRLLGWVKAWLEMAVEEDDGARRSPPYEPCASGAEGDPAGGPDFAAVQQHLHASLHPRLEGAGLRPALQGGNRQLRGRLCATKAQKGGRDGHLDAAMLHEG